MGAREILTREESHSSMDLIILEDARMPKQEKKKHRTKKKGQPMSRREFAAGSMAMLGAYSLAGAATIPPLPAEAQALKLEMTSDVKDLMEARHILDDDIKRVIDHAEKTGDKLYRPDSDRFLSKLLVQKVYFYVEYSPAEGGYQIHTAYSHRFILEEG
jgi:hypothetical protein